jgi:uracil-DNA glycosylase family 4
MSWRTEQRVMLREMGVPAFWPEPPAQADQGASPASPASPAAERAMPGEAGAGAPHEQPKPVHLASPADATEAGSAVATAPVSPPTRPARPPQSPIDTRAAPSAPSGLRPLSQVLPTAASVAASAGTALGPRPEGIDTMAWPALREAVSGCQACGLCASRTQPVFGVGHEQAQWMIVGEAPGEQEDKQGEPFVGRSGQLLDRMLHAVGLTREVSDAQRQVFIANVLKCRPPANRNPLPQEMAQCEPYLLRQVALVKPQMILAMGRFAVQSLLQSNEPIGKLRGRVHTYAGVPLVVTYHPAYLLRTPTDKALAWDDLCLAREVLARQQQA